MMCMCLCLCDTIEYKVDKKMDPCMVSNFRFRYIYQT